MNRRKHDRRTRRAIETTATRRATDAERGLTEAVLPSPRVAALVRHDEPPDEVPIDLAAFVQPVDVDGEVVDWHLTDDVIAFGEPEVLDRYVAWRGAWERCLILDPAASIRRLADVADGLLDRELRAPTRSLVADGFESVVAPDELGPLVRAVGALGEALRHRDATGFGVVDATPGTTRTGLVAAWSPGDEPQLLAGDAHLRVLVTPVGVRLERAGQPPLDGVVEVSVLDSSVRVEHAGGVAELDADKARPLCWIAPGAAAWRVRAIPEVVVWARTLTGIEEAARYAGALGLPVRFSCRL